MITLPYYSIAAGKVRYLNQADVLDLGDSSLDTFDRALHNPLHRRLLHDYGVIVEPPPRAERDDKKVLFIEPHPDDLALSCGGFLIHAAAQHRVDVLTVFTRGPLETFPWKKQLTLSECDYDSLRAQESTIAIEEFLGCNNQLLAWELAVRRDHRSPYEMPNEQDAAITSALTRELVVLLQVSNYSLIVAPLGVGAHIDHLICHEAVKSLKLLNRTAYFEDMPYARNRLKHSQRLETVMRSTNLRSRAVDITAVVKEKAALSAIYKSQLDDFNFVELKACIVADGRAVAEECAQLGDLSYELAERLWLARHD